MAHTTVLPATIEQQLQNWCDEHFVEFNPKLPADNTSDKTVRSYCAAWERPQRNGLVHLNGNRYTIDITVDETRTSAQEKLTFLLRVDGGQRFEEGNNYLLQYCSEKRVTSFDHAVDVLELFYTQANALKKSDLKKTSVPFARG